MKEHLIGQLPHFAELYVPHVGWLAHAHGDDVAQFLAEGWFEAREQAFCWLYLRPGERLIDAGAHAGLYTLLGAHAGVKVTAIEPHSLSLEALRSNIAAHGCDEVAVIPQALDAAPGAVLLHTTAQGPPYSYLSVSDGVEVQATSLDTLNLGAASLVKLDIEGAEPRALDGAAKSIALGHLPVWMIEFTRANLERAGSSPEALFAKLTGLGYQVCRFTDDLELEPLSQAGECGYENYFAVADLAYVSGRIRNAPKERRRIALDLVRRGAAAKTLAEDRARLRSAQEQLAGLDAAYARLGAADWTIADLSGRLDQSRAETASLRGEGSRLEAELEESRNTLRQALEERKSVEDQLRANLAAQTERAAAAESRERATAEALAEAVAGAELLAARLRDLLARRGVRVLMALGALNRAE